MGNGIQTIQMFALLNQLLLTMNIFMSVSASSRVEDCQCELIVRLSSRYIDECQYKRQVD